MPRMPSLMIALYPSRAVAEQLSMWKADYEVDPPYPVYDPLAADPDYDGDLRVVPPWEMHVTLLTYSDVTIEQGAEIIKGVKRTVANLPKQTARVGGYGEFITGYEYACVALIDSTDVHALRDRLLKDIRTDAEHDTDHGFTPHITLAYSYLPEAITLQPMPALEMVFDGIYAVYGFDGPTEYFAFEQVTKTAEEGVLQEKIDSQSDLDDHPRSDPESVTTLTGKEDMEAEISKAVWSTAFINDLPDSAFLYVESGGEKDGDGKTAPRSLRHFPVKGADGEVDVPHLRNAIARIPQSNAPGLSAEKKASLQEKARTMLESAQKTTESTKAGRRMSGQMLAKLSDAFDVIKGLVAWAGYSEDDDEEDDMMMKAMETGEMVIFKDAAGDDRWISFSSNAFEDREADIVATKALEDDVMRAEQDGNRGPLRLWHLKGTDIGDCDFQGVHGRFLIESGTFRDTSLSRSFREYASKTTDKLGVSIGFRYPIEAYQGGVYSEIKIFERSVCPLEAAANPWTSFETIPSGGIMDDKQKEWLSRFAGADRATSILNDAEEATKQLEGLHAFKATAGDPEPEPAAPEPDPTPEGEPDAETIKARNELLEAVSLVMDAKLAPVLKAIQAIDTQGQINADVIKTIQTERDAEKTRAATAPRGAGFHASQVDDNVLSFEETKKALEAQFATGAGDSSPVSAWVDDIIGSEQAKVGGVR